MTLNYLYNRNLFSNHYLESLVKENPEWKEDVTDAFDRAKKIYNSRTEWNRMGESMLEEFLIRPILKNVLGHHFIPQARVEQNARRPDYAFFENETDLNDSIKNSGSDDFYMKAAALGEAKSWKTLLDKKIKGVKASFEFQNPSFQIDYYLHVTPVQWGILTNGHHWRLYNKETSYKLDSYYEIDLVTILDKNDIEGFKYFYLFFRLDAFKRDASRKNFLDRVNEESSAYAKKLGDNLQKNVYEAMELLSIGFLSHQDNGLTKNENDLREVQENTLKLLYRLLFIFFAESRKLLNIDNPEYNKLSLESIKYDIANKKDSGERILSVTTDYWNKLNTLFALINEGSESERFKIAREILYIPAYNGGLFDPKRNPFLHGKKIGDEYIAKAIDLMAREDKEFIDYSTLGTRQLGSIYEGLLEYRLKVATEDLAAVKEKGHEKWITRKEAEGKKSFFEIRAGEIYLATDKGERKATGSYYTPDYIVKYIVRNTLTPILDERRITWKEKGLGERPFLHDILSIRVLDPAMGSGHFLVEACEFLANRLVEAWGEARPEDLESEEVAEHDVHWARREVVRHCIFGVDLNPMAVELAKLSLWLETVAANKPLTFLDHHLKVGNSLIGAKVEDLRSLPTKEKKEAAVNGKQLKTPTLWDFTVKKHFEELLAKYGEFAAHPDDDLRSVKLKEQEYDALQKSEINRRLHEMANAWVSSYFGAVPPPDEYAQMQNEMNPKDFPDWGKWREREWFRRAQEIAGEKRFFHWELEFPESFYEKGAPRENPGWDAVVGNPPYLRIQELQKVDSIQINFFNATFVSATSNYDIYVLFNEFGLECLKVDGRLGMIQPSKFIQADFGKGIRKILPKYLDAIIDFRENQIFDVSTYTCLLFLSKIDKQEWNYLAVPALRNVDVEMPIILDQKLDSSIISRNLTEAPWILSKQDNLNILKKLNVFPQQLKDVVTNIFQGIATSADHIYFLEEIERISADKIKLYSHSTNSEWILETTYLKPLLKGENVHRYEPLEPNIWRIFPYDISGQNPRLLSRDELKDNSPKLLEYLKLNEVELRNREHGRFNNDEWWQFSRPQNLMLYAKKKMMTPDICNKGEISYDNTGYCHTTTIYSFIFKDECQENILFWNSVLNSSLVWYFISNTGSILRGGFFRFKTNYLKPIPIRRISFTTPPDRRADLVEQAKALYSDFLGATDSDRINRMDRIDQAGNPVDPVNPVRTVASPGADSQKLLEFVGARLSSAPEESDVVHDLLAHLAERMIEMNREKNAEIKGFLRWLEGEIGAPVEDLTNKTALREYYAHDFEGFAGALAKNKKKLKSGYDPTRREPKEKLQDEFNASVGKLVPLLDKIDATDRLIDQIVYKLYGLNNDEIKIVEGSISGTKDLNTKENTK